MFKDTSRIWAGPEPYACRIKVQTKNVLTPETGLLVDSVAEQLSFYDPSRSIKSFWSYFQGSPRQLSTPDGEKICEAISIAEQHPKHTDLFGAPSVRAEVIQSEGGFVTIPVDGDRSDSDEEVDKEEISHTEIQALLLKCGSDLGLDVWVARNDQNREFSGQRFSDIHRLLSQLPSQFDKKIQRTIELIDVLWLQVKGIIKAFEIESTTSIYSGLLRMSDLVSMLPNLNVDLYIVAPDSRRQKVFDELNRPTFACLSPSLPTICRYISFSQLKSQLDTAYSSNLIKRLKPDFIDDIAERLDHVQQV